LCGWLARQSRAAVVFDRPRDPALTDQPAKLPFSFANYADDFDRHIERSIRGYRNLIEDCVELSQYFVEDDTVVCDIGCATGRTLATIRARNQERAPGRELRRSRHRAELSAALDGARRREHPIPDAGRSDLRGLR
jgi:hypothetical protein